MVLYERLKSVFFLPIKYYKLPIKKYENRSKFQFKYKKNFKLLIIYLDLRKKQAISHVLCKKTAQKHIQILIRLVK